MTPVYTITPEDIGADGVALFGMISYVAESFVLVCGGMGP